MKKQLFLFALTVSSRVLFAQPSANINIQPGSIIALPSNANPRALAIADYNQDFRNDIAVCQQGLNSVAVYLQSNGSFSNLAAGTYSTGTAPSGLVTVPLGRSPARANIDLVAVSGPSSLYTLLTNNNNGSGSFTPVVTSGNFFGASNTSVNPQLAAKDLDSNGWADFIYSHDDPSVPVTSGIYWQRLNTSTNVATGFASYFRPGYRPSSFALDDFDRDGIQDLVITSLTSNEFSIALATSNGSSGPDWRFANQSVRLPSGGIRPVHVATSDVNRDLLPDIAIAHEGSSEITLFLNLRNTQFGAQASYQLSAAPRKVLLKDLNNDGGPEMIVITADNRLQIFQHTGAQGLSRYGTPITFATGADPVTMELADIDGDYVQDIVVACVGDNTVRVYLNRSLALATRAAKLDEIDIFPNPASTTLDIQCSTGSPSHVTACLLDELGRDVRKIEMNSLSGRLLVADLPRGIYMLRLSSTAGASYQRVVLQ